MDPILRILQRRAYSDPDNKEMVWQYLHHLERLTSATAKNQPLTEPEILTAAKAVGQCYAELFDKINPLKKQIAFISPIDENNEFTAIIIFDAESLQYDPGTIEEKLWNECYDILWDHFVSVYSKNMDMDMEITPSIKYWDTLNLNKPVYVEVKGFLPNFYLGNQLNI